MMSRSILKVTIGTGTDLYYSASEILNSMWPEGLGIHPSKKSFYRENIGPLFLFMIIWIAHQSTFECF